MHFTSSKRVVLALFALSIGLAGCAGAGGSGSSRGRSTTRITAEELMDVQQLDAYQAVQRLRGQWLRSRGGNSPQVVLDGMRQPGGLESLRSIRVADIQEMRFMNSTDATNRYGTGFDGGAILVTTKR